MRRDDPRRVGGGLPPQTAPSVPAGKVESHCADCVVSCETASTATPVLAAPITPKSEARGGTCCAKDLCDGVAPAGRSLWALAGGLLLSPGPTFLWALL